MIVRTALQLKNTKREVNCPKGGFTSLRFLLKQDGMGYTLTQTTVYKTPQYQKWHYKKHLETCYCIRGKALLKNTKTNEVFVITPGTAYILDKHDPHMFKSLTAETVLVCVFNPPLIGREVHKGDGSYD